MVGILGNLMLGAFAAGVLIWLLQIWRADRTFGRLEKVRSVTFAAAFVLGFLSMAAQDHKIGAVICLMGFAISEFAAAVVFYENYKDMEIPHE